METGDKPLRVGVVAGELSGDQLGASLLKAMRSLHPQVRFEGVAGPLMREAGCHALVRTEHIAVMGLAEVLGHLPRLLRIRYRLKRHFLNHPPDVFVGIDSPDFNLPLEKSLRQAGIPAIHWVSPSVWAWRQYRMRKIRNSVDLMMTLFPFEAQYYTRHGVAARFTGHPLADEIPQTGDGEGARTLLQLDPGRPCIALLPGSRESEVHRLLPVFLRAARICAQALENVQFVIPVAASYLMPLCREWVAKAEFSTLSLTLVEGKARTVMQAADCVLLASGTATLECLLLKRPMVVAYRLHPLSYALVKYLLKVPYVSLPNHLLARTQVPEFLQRRCSAQKLAQAVLELLQRPEKAAQQIEPYHELHRQLRQNAAQQAAEIIFQRGSH